MAANASAATRKLHRAKTTCLWRFFRDHIGLGAQSFEHANVLSENFLEEMTLTHYILISVIFWSHLISPICLKMPECAIFSTFRESHLKHTPKVGVHRENLLIGNVAQTVFGGFYICWDYVISFSQHFPMRKFSPSPSTSPSPESHALFENWLKIGNKFFKIIFYLKKYFS